VAFYCAVYSVLCFDFAHSLAFVQLPVLDAPKNQLPVHLQPVQSFSVPVCADGDNDIALLPDLSWASLPFLVSPTFLAFPPSEQTRQLLPLKTGPQALPVRPPSHKGEFAFAYSFFQSQKKPPLEPVFSCIRCQEKTARSLFLNLKLKNKNAYKKSTFIKEDLISSFRQNFLISHTKYN
jgi:hypothetical protein